MTGFMVFLGRVLRGVRLAEFAALLVLLALVLGVYLAKAQAGRERGDITAVEDQITDEQRRMRLLQAEVAHLEEPQRLEALSRQLGMGPVNTKHEGTADELSKIAAGGLLPDKGAQTGNAGSAPVVIAQATPATKTTGTQQ